MRRRVIVNIVIAFVILPLAYLTKVYLEREVFTNTYSQSSFSEWLAHFAMLTFFWIPVIFTVFVLLPYNYIILNNSFLKVSLLRKCLIFLAILVALFSLVGSFANIWFYPIWKNLYTLMVMAVIAAIFASMIHFLVDKKKVNDNFVKTLE